MAATKIEIVMPDEAFEPGALVSFEIVVTSLHEFTLDCEPVVRLGDKGISFNEKTITPGGTATWPASIIMPEGSVTIKAESWCASYDFDWRKDSTAQLTIKPGQVAGTSGGFPIGGLVALLGILGIVILGREK